MVRNKTNKENIGIGNVLRSLRIINDLTVKELSEKMSLSSSYICDVESNRKKPSLDLLEKYSDVFGISRSTLLFFDEQGQQYQYEHKQLLFDILQRIQMKS